MSRRRKQEHLKIVLDSSVEHTTPTGWDEMELIHESLPELCLMDIQIGTRFLGKSLAMPLMITGMTGGTSEALKINQALARLAENHKIPLGVGSMRPLFEPRPRFKDYDLRPFAPTIPLLGNIGGSQARTIPPERMERILTDLGYDGICIHLNPAQELVQPEGDRDFRGILEAIRAYQEYFGERLIVKETGAGMSPRTLDLLRSLGVISVDVSGKGGTSWTRVEARRNPDDPFGELMGEWGIPTPVSLVYAVRRGFFVIASGGIRSPLDLAKALILGARLAGIARPVFVSVREEGLKGGDKLLKYFSLGLKKIMLLIGAPSLLHLPRMPYIFSPTLKAWLDLDGKQA